MSIQDKGIDSYDYADDTANTISPTKMNSLVDSVEQISISSSSSSPPSPDSMVIDSINSSQQNGVQSPMDTNSHQHLNGTSTSTTTNNSHHSSHNHHSHHHSGNHRSITRHTGSPSHSSNNNNNTHSGTSNTISDENYYSMAKMYLNNRPINNNSNLGRVNFNMKSEDLDQPWFHKEATRDVSMELLNRKPMGSFLIRPSSQVGSYAMSWVKNNNGDIGHNLIYGLCPGYSLTQNPTDKMERFWSLQKLVEGCDYLKSVIPVSSSTKEVAKSKNAKTSTEVLGRIVERVSSNDPSINQLVWTLSIYGDHSDGSPKSTEKRTYVKYSDEEYTAPEILPLNGGSVNLLAFALERNSCVHSIFINGYEGYLRMSFQPNIGDMEAESIAHIIHTNKSVTLLNLSHNDFTDKGAKVIAEALKHNSTIKFLSLSHNFIAKEGLIALNDAIRVNKTIDFIDVSSQLVKRRNIINLIHSDVERTLMTLLEDTMKRKCELFGMYEIRDIQEFSTIPQSIMMNQQQQQQQQQNINFSISLQKLPYFHGFLTKQQAEKRLNAVGNQPGSFLFYLNYYIPNSIFLAIQIPCKNNQYQQQNPQPQQQRLEIVHKMIHRVHFGYRFVNGGLSQFDQDNLRDEIMEEEALYNFQINNSNRDNTVTHTNSYNYSYRYRPKRKGCGVVIPTLFEFCSWILASHPQYREIYEQLHQINGIIGDRFQDIHDLVPLWGSRDVKPVVALSQANRHNISRKGVYPTLSQLYKLNKSKLTKPITRDQYTNFKIKNKK